MVFTYFLIIETMFKFLFNKETINIDLDHQVLDAGAIIGNSVFGSLLGQACQ